MSQQPGGPFDAWTDQTYRVIQWVFAGDVVLGALMVLAGEYLWPSRPLQYVGLGLALIGGVLYYLFRWLERQALRRAGGDDGR